MREVWKGFVIALRRWPTMLVLTGMIAVACLVLSLALGDVLAQRAVLRGSRQLRERFAVSFTAFYPHGISSTVDEDTVEYFMSLIDQQKAYTVIIGNMGIDEPNFAGGNTVIVLFGDVLRDLFPDLQLSNDAPSAMVGAELAAQNIKTVRIAGEDISVMKTLPAGATFFDTGIGAVPLDRRIVVFAPTRMLPLLHYLEREEALVSAVLLAPTEDAVDNFVSRFAQGRLFLVPHDLAVDQGQRFRGFMIASTMYIAGMLAFLALVLTAFVASSRLTMRQEYRTFKIREMCGATSMHTSLQVGGFLATVVLLLPIALLSFLLLIGGPYAVGALWVILAVVINFGFLWFISVREVLVQDQIR